MGPKGNSFANAPDPQNSLAMATVPPQYSRWVMMGMAPDPLYH